MRTRLSRFQIVFGPLFFLAIAVLGTASYFAYLLLLAGRLPEALLGASVAILSGAVAWVLGSFLDKRERRFLDAARQIYIGTKWLTPDDREITAESVRRHDLAIGGAVNGKLAHFPIEVLRQLDGNAVSGRAPFHGLDLSQRKEEFIRAEKKHLKVGFSVGIGTIFCILPALAWLSTALADPMYMKIAMATLFIGVILYTLKSLYKAQAYEDLARMLA